MPIRFVPLNHNKQFNLLGNARFYILATSFLASLIVYCLLQINVSNQQLLYIRVEQVYGFIALGIWYVALLITPVQKIFGPSDCLRVVQFSRRALGVSAAYFAVLHAAISLWGQLGGIGQAGLLPIRFKVSLLLGAIAIIVLVLMAATSFDVIIRLITIRRWKILHRFGYAAAVLAMLHVWAVGTHAGQFNISLAVLIMLLILIGLESYAISRRYAAAKGLQRHNQIAVFLTIWFMLGGLAVMTPQIVGNYHGENHRSHTGGAHGG